MMNFKNKKVMLNIQNLVEDLILELATRVGPPDLGKADHIKELFSVMEDFGISQQVQIQIRKNLLNEVDEKEFKLPILNKEIPYKDSDGNTKRNKVGNLITLPDEHPGRKAAERELDRLSPEEEQKAKDEIGGQGKSTADKQKEKQQTKTDTTDDGDTGPQTVTGRPVGADLSNPDGEYQKREQQNEPDVQSKEVKSFDTKKTSPQNGKVSDIDDEYSDGEIKQKGLDVGYKEVDGFKPAPGNAGSMLAEIMSGDGFSHLNENPNLTTDELTQKLYDQVIETELGKQNLGSKKATSKSKTVPEGKNVDLWNKCKSIAASSITKYKENETGVSELQASGKLGNPVKVRNFYGHEISIRKQVELLESIPGPIYTKRGVEVPKEVVIYLIKKSGGGENPSDTSTITIDKQGRGMVTFHSDKSSTADIQANSTPNMEYEQAKELVEKTDLSDMDKKDLIGIIKNGQSRLDEKEQQLKSAANQPAREISNGNLTQILQNAKDDKNADGTPSKDPTSSRVQKVHSTTYTKRRIIKYLPDGVDYGSATEEQKFKAYLDYMGDDGKVEEPTEDQVKFLYRLAAQQGYDISDALSKIRDESLEIQRETHKKLNERSISLPSGKSIPMGDYLEGKNLIEKLHLNVIDGEKNETGVGKYPGLFNLNMGGALVEAEQLKKCIQVDDTDDFIENFEVGKPGDGEEVTRNQKTGAITGRNIFVFAVTKSGKRIPVAFKTQRSKQGQSGKLNTTYQWDKGIQDCFKSNQS